MQPSTCCRSHQDEVCQSSCYCIYCSTGKYHSNVRKILLIMRVSCILPCQAAMLGASSMKILTMKSFTTISLLSLRTFASHRIRQQSPNFCSGGTSTCLPCFAFKQLIHCTYSSIFDHVNVSKYCPQVIKKMSVAITLRSCDGLAIDNSSTV